MNAKEYLEQSRRIRQEIVWINRQIEEIETSLGYHPIQLDDSGASKSNYREDKMSESLAKVADLYADLQKKKADLIIKDEEIHRQIDKLEDIREREVLRLRYLERHPRRTIAPLGWRAIGFRLGYTAEGARYIHDKAIKKLDKIINSTET
jgi:DNA-directed RNA polymerase specialized sigma subunit